MGLQEKWLSGHTDEELIAQSSASALPGGGTRDYPAGAEIFKEGAPSHELFILLAGRVLVYQQREGGDVILAELGPPEILGEMGCLQGMPRSAHAVAMEDCRLLVIPEAEVDRTITALPRWFVRVVDILINRLRDTGRRVTRESSL